MSTTYRRRSMSEAEREQRRSAERERVKEAAEQLLTSEGWQRWVRARSMFRRYSAHNCMLIALEFHLPQAPDYAATVGQRGLACVPVRDRFVVTLGLAPTDLVLQRIAVVRIPLVRCRACPGVPRSWATSRTFSMPARCSSLILQA